MMCIILKIRVQRTLENNVEIQTKQVVKQFDNKEKFSLSTKGPSPKRKADLIRYQEEIDGATVNVTVKIENSGVKIIRNGDIKSNLLLVEGDTTMNFY